MSQELQGDRLIEVICHSCGERHSIRVPGFFDLLQRPEFASSLLNGDWFRTSCPRGHAGTADVPILVRLGDGELFYVPGEATDEEEDDAALHAILTGLPQEIGRQISDADGRIAMQPLPRGLLPVALASPVIRSLLAPTSVPGPAVLQEARTLAPEVLDLLANHLATRYAYAGNLVELESAVRIAALSVELTPDQHHNCPAHLGNLANHLAQRYSSTRDRSDLEQAIEYATAALDMTAEADARRSGFHNNLAGHLFERMTLTGNAADLDAAIWHAEAALRLTAENDEGRPGYLSNLASHLSMRFMLVGEPTDLDAAIGYAEAAVRTSMPDDLNRPSVLNTLAVCMAYRFEAAGHRDDLERAIESTKAAVELLPEGHVERPVLLNNLANHLSSRFALAGTATDLDAAVGFAKSAVAASQKRDANWPMYLNNLGSRLASRFALSGDRSDLDAAIHNAENAIRHAPEGHEKRAAYLGNLAAHLSSRFKLSGVSADLDAAVRHSQAAVDATPTTHGDRPAHLNNLASHLSMRFAMRSGRADLDAAIAHTEAALAQTSATAADRPMLLCNLAGYLDARFALSGARTDVEKAIECAQAALALAPEGHINQPAYHNNLANYLASRARMTRTVADIDAAVLHAQAALEHRTANHAHRATRHNTLSNMLSDRHGLTGDAGDLDASIVHAESAIRLSSERHSDRPGRLNNLANRLTLRFKSSGSMADLDAAIAASQRAVEETPHGHGYKPGYLHNLSNHLHERYRRSGSREDLEAAIIHAQAALLAWQRTALESEDARAVLARAGQSARHVVNLLLSIGEPDRLVAALETGKAVRLRVELAGSGRSPGHLDAAGQATYQNIRCNLRQLGGDLRALDALPSEARLASHAAEVARLRSRASELRDERERLEAGDPTFSAAALDYAAVRKKALEVGEAIVYLQPMSEPPDRLLALIVHPGSPQGGPAADDMLEIVGFGRTAVRSLLFAQSDKLNVAGAAFVPIPGEPLGWLTANWAAKQDAGEAANQRWLDTMVRVVADLGRHLMTPVARRLDALGVARVVLIPGESLGLLPLHAGPVDAACRPFGERFETRYAPSATALYAAHPPRSTATGAHLIGIANPDGSLPFADIEMHRVAALFGGASHIVHGRDAHRAWLLAEVGKGDLVALSTHASFSMGRPEASYFVLAHPQDRSAGYGTRTDRAPVRTECEKLSLDDILRGALRLTPGALVVADACETGQAATGEAAEEFVGFPAALLASGASAVIATLWAVEDVSTALLMEEMYRRINSGELPARALQQAASWLRQVPCNVIRQRLKDELETVMAAADRLPVETLGADTKQLQHALEEALIDLDNAPQCPFEHPFYWAPFALHGRSTPSRELRCRN
jgi:CHAT domain-containing protein/tetratricopeptide (TPR) repeat protein